MHRRTARGNRIGLALMGLVLTAGGAALVAAHLGWFGTRAARSSIYPPAARRFVHENGDWLWTIVALAAILAGLAFLRWLLVQPRVDRLHRVSVDVEGAEPDTRTGQPGQTAMPDGALCDAVEDDVEVLTGVRRARADLAGVRDAPELWLRVHVSADADLAVIHRTIVGEVVRDARQALDRPELPVHLQLVVARR